MPELLGSKMVDSKLIATKGYEEVILAILGKMM